MGSLWGRVQVAGRGAACVLAAAPSTLLIPLPLTRALTRRFRRERLLQRLHLMVPWARFCRRHILKIELEVEGRAHLPVPSRGHMYVSNHQSWIDILVLMEALDMVAFLSKDLVSYIPLIGACAYAAGSVYVRRRDPGSRLQALRETLRMCEESTAVMVFPEGTRSADGEVRAEIHPATIKAAYQHRLRVVPVGVDGTFRVVPKSMDQINLGQRVAVAIGPALAPGDFADADSWVAAVWGAVKELHAAARGRLQSAGAG